MHGAGSPSGNPRLGPAICAASALVFGVVRPLNRLSRHFAPPIERPVWPYRST